MKLGTFRFTAPLRRVERALNHVVDAVNANRLAVGMGYRLKQTSNGTSLEIQVPRAEAAEAASSVQQYKLTGHFDDYVEAKTWDGTNLGTATVKIAKPYRLRKTGWDGVTVSYDFNGTFFPLQYTYLATPGFRTARHTGSGALENQAIIALYNVGDIIYATEPIGGTGVTVSGTALTWLDLNVDGRHWARY